MQRLMARTAAGNQRDLARRQSPAANEFALFGDDDDVRVRCREAVEAFRRARVWGELRNFFIYSSRASFLGPKPSLTIRHIV